MPYDIDEDFATYDTLAQALAEVVDPLELAEALTQYVRASALQQAIQQLEAAIAAKQPTGDYATEDDLDALSGQIADAQALLGSLQQSLNNHTGTVGAHGSLTVANRLSEFSTTPAKSAARDNLGLSPVATMSVGTEANTVAAGNHTHDARYVKKPTTTPIVLNTVSEAGTAIPGVLTLLNLPDLLTLIDGRVTALSKEMNKHRTIEREGGAAT